MYTNKNEVQKRLNALKNPNSFYALLYKVNKHQKYMIGAIFELLYLKF